MPPLHASLMFSLFLGELYSFNVLARVVLVLTGGVFAFVCNLVRTAILVWVGAHNGIKAIEAWHDPAGLTILLVCLFGLWGLSLLMQRRSIFCRRHQGMPKLRWDAQIIRGLYSSHSRFGWF